MNKNKPIDIVDSKNKYKSWSKCTEEDGWSKKVRVEEIENGYLVSMTEEGMKNDQYESICKRYFSKDNPLKNIDPDLDSSSEDMTSAIKDFLKY